MANNIETRISSEQAKEAIYQAHLSKDAIVKIEELQSSASEIDDTVNYIKQDISSIIDINFTHPNMSIPSAWSTTSGATINGNTITLRRWGTSGYSQSKVSTTASTVIGMKYIVLINLENIEILNPAVTTFTVCNYTQIIQNINIADYILAGKKIIAIPFIATVNGSNIQFIANPSSAINTLPTDTDVIRFNSNFMGFIPWTQEDEDYWSYISSDWLTSGFKNNKVARASVADYVLEVHLPDSSFENIKTVANRCLNTYNDGILAYNSTSNSVSKFANITNSVFNCGGVVDLTAQPWGRLWYGMDIQPSNYALAKKSYVLVVVGTGVFKNVKYLAYTQPGGSSKYLVEYPIDGAITNIKTMVELNYAQGVNDTSRYTYMMPTRLNTTPATLEYSVSFTTFALFEKVEGFTIDDYITAAHQNVSIPKYKTHGVASESYVNTSIKGSSLGLNSNTFSPKYDVEMLLSGGQSLNVGGSAASSDNDFKNTISFAKGSGLSNKPFTTEADKLAFFGTDFIPIVNKEEFYPPITASTTAILRLLEQENRLDINNFGSAFMPFAWGAAGSPITAHNKGSKAYTDMITVVTKANEFTTAKGKTFAVRAMNWYQGEDDKVQTKDWYYTRLDKMFTDINTDIKAITGQEEDIEFFTYQTAGWADKYMGVQEAQLQLATDRANVHLAGAMYQFAYVDAFHPKDRAIVGLQTGVAIKRVIYDGLGWVDFKPISHKIISNGGKYYIHLKFDVPVKPMRFDTSGDIWHNPSGKQTNYGFEVVSGGIEKQIAEPFITRGDTVVLTTSENPVGMTIKYAVTGHDGGGNLCDSQNITILNKKTDYVIDNFAVAFSNYTIN